MIVLGTVFMKMYYFQGKRKAVCTDNVTDMAVKDLQNESNEDTNIVETFICQSTIIPSDGRGFRTALSSQSISLADIFIGKNTHFEPDHSAGFISILYSIYYSVSSNTLTSKIRF